MKSHLIKVAIVGRPNVGKSALFNTIAKKRKSIVDEEEGVTRDRIYEMADYFGFPFEIIDTGGIDFDDSKPYQANIRRQAEIAIEEADALILVVDSRVGPQELDIELARIVRTTEKPVVLAVNKIDNKEQEYLIHAFHRLGISSMIGISSLHNYNIAELLDKTLQTFDKTPVEEITKDSRPRIAIVGRPNVGKSLLLNSLIDEDRSVVSNLAGTTRDAIDTICTFDGKEYILVDTAGIRKKHKEANVIEKFAAIRTEKAIENADICLLVLDAQSGMTAEEKKIARMIEDAKKGCILLFNKWDLVKGFRMEHCLQALEEEISFLKHCPKLFISAKTHRNLDKIFSVVDTVLSSFEQRITTHKLNKSLIAAMQKYHPPVIKGKRLRVYYMAQVNTCPPEFVLFVNSPHLLEDSYKRYLINHLRDSFDFSGVPLTLRIRGKERKEKVHPHQQEMSHKDRDLNYLYEAIEDEEASSIDSDEFHA